MKKLFALLSLVAFLAVSVNAQTTKQTAPGASKETVAKPEAKADAKATPSCCSKATPACCKNNKDAKACTPEQKAECAKANGGKECTHDHAKAMNEKATPSNLK